MEQTGSMEIKRFTVEDVTLFRESIIQFIHESNTACAFMNQHSMVDAANKWINLYDHLRNDNAVIYGCIFNENGMQALIGFVWAYEFPFREDANRLYVSILHVHEKFRSIGVGKKLMDNVEAYAAARGYNAIYMHVEGVNEKGIKFYDREGYITERIQLVKKLG